MTDPTNTGATRAAGTSSGTAPGTTTATSRAAGDGSEAPDSLVGRVLAERYRVEKLLGSGGMGSVYRAQHVHMRKSVAIKVLHREMTYLPEIVARFEREAVAAARIEHPNVAAATDFGRLEDGSFYLVLEYVEGRNLRELIK
ncbi:MAG: protein kinase domain-containing protein, partial [Steroidobacteraceae bacterium]